MKVPPTAAAQQPSGHTLGRISARKLIALHCRACGRDLLPVLDDALLRGCECQRPSTLRRVH